MVTDFASVRTSTASSDNGSTVVASTPFIQPKNRTTRGLGISDELWAVLQPLLPMHINTHIFGGGRPRVPDRDCADAIFYVLRTGCHWQALDQTGLCAYWTAHDRFQEWLEAGVFLKLWQAGPAQFDELREIDWHWLSTNGVSTKASLCGEKTTPYLADCGRRAKRICSQCHHKYAELAMRRVSLQDGEYRAWTPDHAAYFRRCRLKRPTLIWLCGVCYGKVEVGGYQGSGW